MKKKWSKYFFRQQSSLNKKSNFVNSIKYGIALGHAPYPSLQLLEHPSCELRRLNRKIISGIGFEINANLAQVAK